MEHKKSCQREVAKFILLQRTDLRKFAKLETLARFVLYDTLINIDTLLFSKAILKSYRLAVHHDWRLLLPIIPRKAKTILDIGCGIGGIHKFIFQTYQKQVRLKIYLADYNLVSEKIYYGFNLKAASYCSFDATRSYLAHVRIPEKCFQFIDLNKETLPSNVMFDLIISLLSWGFHYPVDTYLGYVLEHLSPNGTVIIDCRRKTSGLDILKHHFKVTSIAERDRYIRVKCEWPTKVI